MRNLNVFSALAASFLLLSAPLHAAQISSTDEIAGDWTASANIRGQIATAGSFTESGSPVCDVQSTPPSSAAFACNQQGSTSLLSDGTLTRVNNGKKLLLTLGATTLANIEGDIVGQAISLLQAKGKVFDSNEVSFSLTSSTSKPFKVSSANLLVNGKAIIKGRVRVTINGKPKQLKVTYTISPISLQR